MKKCKDCGTEFVKTGRNHIRCSSCKVIEERKKARLYERKLILKNVYGITVEKYNEMFNEQNGCCAICGEHQTSLKKSLAVDHCHTSGEVRGLLCTNCNLLLGYATDDTKVLSNAINYLTLERKNKCKQ